MSTELQLDKSPRLTKRSIGLLRQMARPSARPRSVLEPRNLAVDGDLEKFMRDASDHWKLACITREVFKGARRMSKRGYAKWKEKIFELDDDKPLREVL